MKKYILIIAALASLSLHAQGTKLNLEVIPGKLATQLTEEQMSTITELTLTGEMYNCDFYTIRDKMKVLEILDLSDVMADSIPACGLASMDKLKQIKMSPTLDFIDFAAFSSPNLYSITWSNFPDKIEENAFIDCENLQNYYVSENNPDYISIDGILFSKDKKKLIAFPPAKAINEQCYIIPNEVEEINNAAFMDAFLKEVELPESVNYIGDYAFLVYANMATGSGDCGDALSLLTCNALQPPKLGKSPFHHHIHTILIVPEQSKNLYAKTSEWNMFRIDGVSLDNNEGSSKLNYWMENNSLSIQSNTIISQIDIIDMNGKVLNTYPFLDAAETVNIPNKRGINTCLIRITYQDKSIDVFKLIN